MFRCRFIWSITKIPTFEVVSKPTSLESKYFAMNSFGISGFNGHIVISFHTKVKRGDNLLNERLPWLEDFTPSSKTNVYVLGIWLACINNFL